MTTEQTEIPKVQKQTSFVSRFLPWIIAGGVLLIYLVTLNHWVTLKSLPVFAKVAGWDWRGGTVSPLYFLVTYPVQWFSGSSQFIAFNFLSALFAALTLALLARSVALLPHDRTREQRQRDTGRSFLSIPHGWLPPLLAVLVCGFQFTFWENATAATGEMIDLFIFAYVIRCLLEFRVSHRESWLTRFAIVYGIGVVNNWAMIGFFPLFLVALIWIKGLSFFNYRFMTRMIAFGAIGLLFYLLVPLIAAISSNSDQSAFLTLKNYLRSQKAYLFDLPFKQITAIRGRLMLISLTALLPLLMIGIRWPSFRGGDVSHASGAITAFMFRVMHLFFLGILLFIFFDPKFSARELGYDLFPYLTFYYLTALAVGYFAGYGLLVFGREATQTWARASGLAKIVNQLIYLAVVIAAVAVPIALIVKNYPMIQANNGPALNQYAKSTAESLPASGAVVLSDDLARLFLLRAAYEQSGKPSENILIETSSLPFPQYHHALHQRHSAWPDSDSTNKVSDVEILQRVDALAQSHRVYYLHPSFGYYFERFYPTPNKLAYELKVYPTNTIAPPSLTPEVIAANQTFWSAFIKESLPKLASLADKSSDVKVVNTFYSRALNHWGVELQKAKMLEPAGESFTAAIKLNPDNVVAQINEKFNASLQKGEIRLVKPDDALAKKLGEFRTWETALSLNGPFDEPNFTLQLGETLARGGNLRQSAQFFLRVLELTPSSVGARLGLAKTYIELQRPDEALKFVQELQRDPKIAPLHPDLELELLRLESLSHLAKNDLPAAEKILLNAQQKYPEDEKRIDLLTQIYLMAGQHTNALRSAEKQLSLAPNSQNALFTKAVLHMQFAQYEPAVKALDQLLALKPDNNMALMNRAIANLLSGKLDDAKRDYLALQKSMPKDTHLYQIYFGLGQIAGKQKNKSEEIKNYKLYLKHAPTHTAEYKNIEKRLKELESGN